MWLWRADTGLWEKDPAAPIGFEAHLMDVAFDPGNPDRGYAVGRTGALLRYGKSWAQEALPAGFGSADLTQVAFAGSQALVAAGQRPARQRRRRLAGRRRRPRAARLDAARPAPVRGRRPARRRRGRRRRARRDRARRAGRALALLGPAAARLDRDRGRGAAGRRPGARAGLGRAAAAAIRRPTASRPSSIRTCRRRSSRPFPLPPDGYVLRETGSGWRDEQHTAFRGSGIDRPIKSDPILDFDVDASGSRLGGRRLER